MQWITEDLLLNAALGSRMQQGGAAALPREAHWTIDRALLKKKKSHALRDDLWKLQGFRVLRDDGVPGLWMSLWNEASEAGKKKHGSK